MKKLGIATAVALTLALAGCSDPEPVDENHDGELTDDDPKVEQDNSPYDEYTFEAGEGWTVDIDMTSEAFDTYLWLIGPQGNSLVQNDDATPGQGTNSHITHTTTESGTFRVRANSYDGAGRGAYHVHIVARPGN